MLLYGLAWFVLWKVTKTVDCFFFFQLEVDTVIEQCQTAISTLNHCKGLLQVEASHLQEKVYELQEHKNSNEALTQGHPPDQANQRW